MLLNFIAYFRESVAEKNLQKLSLSKALPTRSEESLRNVYARLVQLKTGWQVQFTLRYSFRDVIKNLSPEAAEAALLAWLKDDFAIANLHTNERVFTLERKKMDYLLRQVKNNAVKTVFFTNNLEKTRRLSPINTLWLHRLGITSAKGDILKEKQAKFKQIDKYLEIMEGLISGLPQQNDLQIVDMGAGKGYLTFALYDLLQRNKQNPTIFGIEQRKDIVETANYIAEESGFEQLKFIENTIETYSIPSIDVLIALHACDTATDEALAKGIQSGANLIVVAPCCHKQVRRAMQPPASLKPALQHGILLERQAELVTDAIRALVLEKQGYTTKVFEFISLEHTGKNVMITAVRHAKKVDKLAIQAQIDNLKAIFGIEYQTLDRLFSATPSL